MKRRIISLLMCAVMTCSLLPTAAWAELLPAQSEAENAAPAVYAVSEDTAATEDAAAQSGENEDENAIALFAAHEAEYAGVSYPTLVDAFAAAAENPGGTVKLLKDATLDCTADDKGIIWTSGDVTLDLNGKTMTKSADVKEGNHASEEYAVFCLKGGSLTIMDSATGSKGKIVQPNDNPVVAVTGGTLTVNSGTLEATKTDGYKDSIMQWYVSCAVFVLFNDSNLAAYLNGGTFSGGTAGVIAGNSTVYITGGEFYGATSYALYANAGKAAVLSGGTYKTGATNGNSIYHATGWETNYEATALLASNYQYMNESGSEAATISDDQRGVVGNAKVVPKDGAVEYIGAGGKKAICTTYTKLTGTNTNTLYAEWYVVTGNVTITDNLIIGASDNVNLILCDEATLTVEGQLEANGGLSNGATLNVYLQKDGTGTLVTTGGISPVSGKSDLTIKSPGTPMKREKTIDDGFTLSKCDHDNVTYTEEGKTAAGHSGKCALCDTTVSGTHTYGTWTPVEGDNTKHTASCAVCTYTVTAKHTFDLSPNGDGLTHEKKCDTCEYKVEEDHSYDNNTCACGAVLTATCGETQYADLTSAIAAAKDLPDGGTVTLARDVDETITVSSGTVTIDLNTHTWSATATPLTVSGGTVTLKNGVLRQLSDDSTKKGNGLLITGGSVTVGENTIIDGMARAIDLQGGSLTLGEGATLVGGLKVPTGKTLSSCLTPGTAFVKCTVNGTTVTPNKPTEYVSNVYTASESDSTIAMTVVHHTHQIINGNPCDCGYECPSNHSAGWDTETCPTCGMAASAQVTDTTGTKYYAEFADAFIAANKQENCTLKLLQDGSINARDPVYITGPFTLDLNGHTVEVLAVGWSHELETPISGSLTLKDSSTDRSGAVKELAIYAGTLNISNALVEKLNCVSGTVTASGNIGFSVGSNYMLYWEIGGGKLTIGENTTVGDAQFSTNGGSITVTGGTFGYTRFSNSNNGTTAISGGTFGEITTGDSAQLMTLLAKGYAFEDSAGVKDGTATSLTGVTVKEHTHTINDGACACGVKSIVSDDKGGIYSTLQAALNAAASDSTIQWVQLNKDVTESVTFDHPGASVKLNMNGKTLTCKDGIPLTVESGTLTVTDEAIITQNRASDDADTFPAVKITGGELVFEGVLNATGGVGRTDHVQKPGVQADGGTLEFKAAVHLEGGLTMTGNAVLRGGLKLDSTFTGDSQATDTNTLNVNGSAKYTDLRGLLENDNTLAYKTTNTIDQELYSVTPGRIKDAAAHLLIVSHTHDYQPGNAGTSYIYSYCACGLSCNHAMNGGYQNGVCKNCHVACPHPKNGVNTTTYTCGNCSAQLAASVTIGETTTYYVGLANALNAAGAEKSGTVKVNLLQNTYMWLITANGVAVYPTTTHVNITGGAKVTLNLNGYTVTGPDGDNEEDFIPINIKAGTLRIDTDDNTNTGALNRTKINVLSGGTLNLSYLGAATIEAVVVDGGVLDIGTNSKVTINTLTLTNPKTGEGGTSIESGTFGKIIAGESLTAVDITSRDPYVFQHADGTCVKRTEKINGLENVTVVKCPHKEIDADSKCTICGEVMRVKITAADGSVSYAENLTTTALKKGVVTLLTSVGTGFLGSNPASGTIDLNGNNLTGTTSVQKTLILQNTGSQVGKVAALTLGENELYGEGTLVIDSDSVTVTKLTVVKDGGTKLTRGTFGTITVSQSGLTAMDLLAAGCAFADANGAVVDANVATLTDVHVVEHTKHDGPDCPCGYKCTHTGHWQDGQCQLCGYECPHTDVNTNTYTCNICTQQVTAKMTGADGTTTAYYADGYYPNSDNTRSGLDIAFEKAESGSTATVLGGSSVTAFLDGSKSLTLALNGKDVASIYVGRVEEKGINNNLIVTGSGNIKSLYVHDNNSADLTGWSSQMGTLYVYPSGKVKLSGGTFDSVALSGNTAGSLLASGYAFQDANEKYVAYTTTANLSNVTVVLCPHASVTNNTCDYCNTANIAAVLNGEAYTDVDTAIGRWIAEGGTLTLHTDVADVAASISGNNRNWSCDSTKSYTLDLNGHKLVDNKRSDDGKDTPSFTITATNMKLTIRDTSTNANANGQLDNLLLGGGASLTLESGWLGYLNVTDKAGEVSLQGGGLHYAETAVPWAYLLPDGYDLKEITDLSSHGTGHQPPYTVQKVPATFGGGKIDRMPYGKNHLSFQPTVTLDAGAEEPNQIAFAWYLWDGAEAKNLTNTYLVKNGTDWVYRSTSANADYSGLTVGGKYSVFAVVKATGQSTNDVLWRAALTGYTLEVTKGDLNDAVVELDNEGNGNTVDGKLMFLPKAVNDKTGQTLTQNVKVTLYNKPLDAENYEVSGNTGADAGDYTLTVTAKEGSTLYSGSKEQKWSIAPFQLDYAYVKLVKPYDGTTKVNKDAATVDAFSGVSGLQISGLVKGEDYELSDISDEYPSADQDQYTGLHATVKLKNPNYVFTNGTMVYKWEQTKTTDYCKIDYATAPVDSVNTTLTVSNNHAGTYTLDVSQLLPALAEGCSYGDQTHYLIELYGNSFVTLNSRYYDEGTATIDKSGLLTLPIKAVESTTETSIGTVKVRVNSRNYLDFNIVVTVNAANKLVPTGAPTLDKTAITYGETVGSITLSGSMTAGGETVKGTFTWDAPNATPDAQTAYQAAWTFTPADTQHYLAAHGTATITIDRAALKDVSVKQVGTLTYNGSAQAAQVEAKATTVDGAAVRFRYGTHPYGSFAAEMPKFTNAGTYTVYYEAVDPSLNHEPVGGSFTVTISPRPITGAVITLGGSLTYNGTAQTQTVTSVKLGELDVTYTVSGSTAINAGTYTLTVTGTGNYTGTAQGTFTVTKAAALTVSPIRLDVTNNYASEYTADLRAALDQALPENSRLGAVTYDAPQFADDKGYCDAAQAAIFPNGVLTLPVKAVNTAAEGEAARVTVTVTCGNFENTAVTVVLYAANKPVPTGTPTPSRTILTYGEALNSITLSGKMTSGGENVPGTFAWKEPNLRPAAGELTAAWVFTPDDGKYAAVTGTIRLTVSEPVVPTYTVGGTVKTYSLTDPDAVHEPAANAIVTIRKGVEILGGQKRTDANGAFSLDGVPAGVYNVVVEYQGKTVTQKVEIIDQNVAGLNVEIPLEDVNSKLDIKDSGGLTEDLVVGGLEKEANDQFNKDGTAASGGSVDVKMEIESKPENKNDAEQSAIREAAKEKALDFIDMALSLVRNGEEKPLPETRNVLEIIISYDTSRAGITVIRHHDGNVENFKRLDSLTPGQDMTFYVDEANKCIHIFTSRFSTYAIGYEPAGSSGGSSGGTRPSIAAEKTSPDARSATDYTDGIYGLTFRSSASFAGFRGVQVDGKTIDPSNYIAEEGSIVVYLKAVYLRTLKPGKHTVTILSSEGDATTSFTTGGNSSPATGDAGLLPYAALALTGCTGMALTLRRKRRED